MGNSLQEATFSGTDLRAGGEKMGPEKRDLEKGREVEGEDEEEAEEEGRQPP